MNKKNIVVGLLICVVVILVLLLIFFGLLRLRSVMDGAFFKDVMAEGLAWPIFVIGIILLILGSVAWVVLRRSGVLAYSRLLAVENGFDSESSSSLVSQRYMIKKDISMFLHLRQYYGWFRWRQVRLLLVVGEPAEVNSIVPGLVEEQWLEGRGVVLLYGGSASTALDTQLLDKWRWQFGWRGIDGLVWALRDRQTDDRSSMSISFRQLQDIARYFGKALPLYLWNVCESDWEQSEREVRAVGCLLTGRRFITYWEERVGDLQCRMRKQGLAQMRSCVNHDFLLRLARDLQVDGTARWRSVLESLSGRAVRGVQLRGLWFSLPIRRTCPKGLEHHWPEDPAWSGILNDRSARPGRLGWNPGRVVYASTLGVAAVWGIGLLLSFTSNRAELGRVEAAYRMLEQPEAATDPAHALAELVRELSRLDYRGEHGAPWYQRFGLNRSDDLREAVWPLYVEANDRLLRDPAASDLERQLTALVNLAPGSPARAKLAQQAYDQLKAYLMLARPEKGDVKFLVDSVGATQPAMWRFYAEHLPDHPEWAIKPNPRLIGQVRQVLLAELGQRNAEATLYQQILDTAANHYPPLALQQMVGDADATSLFTSTDHVPGVFTRDAWEGQVRSAIDDAAKARREEIDWVLSDNAGDVAAELSPEQLKERLTARYFRDYSSAWLAFLNSLRWQQSDSLHDVIAQLTVMSDARQSPLIALMNTLSYQGQAGVRGQALADSLIESAQKLVGQKAPPMVDQLAQAPGGPLDSTFGPLMALLGKDPEGRSGNDQLSLQAFLTRVTSVRLKLQQITNAPDPQAMTQALAQTVFQGKGVDLTDAQSYGNLIAASLGAEWGPVARALFVQPLTQAWQQILQPSSAGLNRDWQRAIVDEWHGAFDNRYPFAASSSDASLPMLGQMIRADSGRIEQFLNQQLNGLVRKEGSRWVIDPRQSQGLRFNPAFLDAINQLSQLADVLYTDGGMGMSFELRGKPVQDVVQTTFVLNGEKHHYFNQRERWQRFRWPGQGDHPGISLTWTSIHGGERLYADYQGTWGLIRLLEEASVAALDDGDSRFRVVLSAPDGLGLTWHLRTELAEGPLALLKLRSFRLPRDIFLVDDARYAQNGGPQ
ncbi:ImcF-related family protein [Pseudomonas putida]|uniref:ImcF-related family protein n=1 Tax=Pseudomonas putida TaxID=303 RepID=UPI00383B9077